MHDLCKDRLGLQGLLAPEVLLDLLVQSLVGIGEAAEQPCARRTGNAPEENLVLARVDRLLRRGGNRAFDGKRIGQIVRLALQLGDVLVGEVQHGSAVRNHLGVHPEKLCMLMRPAHVRFHAHRQDDAAEQWFGFDVREW